MIQIALVYVAPNTSWEKYQKSLRALFMCVNHLLLVVIGDFKSDVSINQTRLLQFLAESKDLIQHVTQLTTDSSILDLVFSNVDPLFVSTGVIEICWSDHKLVWSHISGEYFH